ncbi:hypothetical protein O3P69_017601 [Scylla paramamosain]|uniref:Uncharacterized protein n=1 Tax=Scylla paramamosain TaxID=85552 RepID=A0AAW0TXT5_SCYPA
MQTGEEPTVLRRLMEIERMAIYQLLETHIIEPIKGSYPQQYIKEVAAKFVNTFRQDLLMMQLNAWASPTLLRLIQKIIYMSQARNIPAGTAVGECVEVQRAEAPPQGERAAEGAPLPSFLEDLATRSAVNLTEAQTELVCDTLGREPSPCEASSPGAPGVLDTVCRRLRVPRR